MRTYICVVIFSYCACILFTLLVLFVVSMKPGTQSLFVFFIFRMELRVGNKYRLGRKIGSGSFGDIYLGNFGTKV